MCEHCRDAAEVSHEVSPTPNSSTVATQTAIRAGPAKHYQVFQQGPDPSKNTRKYNRRRKNKAVRAQKQGQDQADAEEVGDEGDGENEWRGQEDITRTVPATAKKTSHARAAPNASSGETFKASMQIISDGPIGQSTSTNNASMALFSMKTERSTPLELVSELTRAQKQLEGEIARMEDRISLSRVLRAKLAVVDQMEMGRDNEDLVREWKVLKARWEAGL